jgi:ribosomal protein L32E
MDIEKLIEQLKNLEACAYGYHINGEVLGMDCSDFEQVMVDAADEISKVPTLQAENEKLRAELEQVKRCIEIVENQRDSAIKELENYMVQDVLDGNEPCAICAKASDTPCEYCNPKWRGQKED